MKKEIKIPDIAENVDEGVIGRILVSKGDQVKEDQPVVEVETDKAATDIPSPYTGTIEEIKVEEGDEVTVDQVIMVVEVEGDGDEDTDEKGEGKADEAEEDTEKKKEQDDAGGKDTGEEAEAEESGKKEKTGSGEEDSEMDEDDEEASGEEVEGADVDSEEPGESGEADEEHDEDREKDEDEKRAAASGQKTAAEDIPAAPSVRRMAREAGVDLSEVKGSGPGNRITAEDITAAKEEKGATEKEGEKKKGAKAPGKKKKAGAAERESAIELPDFSKWGETKKEKMNTVRKITARTMTASWQQIPQVTQFDEADITDIEAFRQAHKDDYEKQGGKLTVTAILLKIAAFALQKFPRFNSSIDTSDNTLVMKQYINIGVAVDTDKGLMVPVIRDTDKKSLGDISVETVELAKKARENEISAEELQGGNFTISNLGGIGGTGFTPIVYAPQVAILGVSRASEKQVFTEDRFQQRLVLPLTLTYDHRVIDGADGARFLRWICDVLEDPYALLR